MISCLKGSWIKDKLSEEEAQQLFESFLYKGILSNAGTGSPRRYDVPIPSMKQYIFEEAQLNIQSPEADNENED